MKVMFVVERMEVGGAQRQIAYMANHLSRRNIEVSLLVVKKKGEMIDKIVPEVEIVSCFRLASRMPFLGVIFQSFGYYSGGKKQKAKCYILSSYGISRSSCRENSWYSHGRCGDKQSAQKSRNKI